MLTLEIKKKKKPRVRNSSLLTFCMPFSFFFLDAEHVKESMIKGFHLRLLMIWLAFLMSFVLLKSKCAASKPFLSLAWELPSLFYTALPAVVTLDGV